MPKKREPLNDISAYWTLRGSCPVYGPTVIGLLADIMVGAHLELQVYFGILNRDLGLEEI